MRVAKPVKSFCTGSTADAGAFRIAMLQELARATRVADTFSSLETKSGKVSQFLGSN